LDNTLGTLGSKGAKNAEHLCRMFGNKESEDSDLVSGYPLLDRPTVFIESTGLVIAWYIPEAFGVRRCVRPHYYVTLLSSLNLVNSYSSKYTNLQNTYQTYLAQFSVALHLGRAGITMGIHMLI
jgi:hypothetical protein